MEVHIGGPFKAKMIGPEARTASALEAMARGRTGSTDTVGIETGELGKLTGGVTDAFRLGGIDLGNISAVNTQGAGIAKLMGPATGLSLFGSVSKHTNMIGAVETKTKSLPTHLLETITTSPIGTVAVVIDSLGHTTTISDNPKMIALPNNYKDRKDGRGSKLTAQRLFDFLRGLVSTPAKHTDELIVGQKCQGDGQRTIVVGGDSMIANIAPKGVQKTHEALDSTLELFSRYLKAGPMSRSLVSGELYQQVHELAVKALSSRDVMNVLFDALRASDRLDHRAMAALEVLKDASLQNHLTVLGYVEQLWNPPPARTPQYTHYLGRMGLLLTYVGESSYPTLERLKTLHPRYTSEFRQIRQIIESKRTP